MTPTPSMSSTTSTQSTASTTATISAASTTSAVSATSTISTTPAASETPAPQPLVGIIMGSDSDLPVMQEAAAILALLEVPYEVTIVSAHRTPERMVSYGKEARQRGLQVIIAGAGGAAHLPGMVASLTPLPVIGVPVKSRQMNGLDSLLSIVQMPGGIPVATVAINGARNAGLLAARMLALGDEALMERLDHWIQQQTDQVLKKAEALETMGVEAFLEGRQGNE